METLYDRLSLHYDQRNLNPTVREMRKRERLMIRRFLEPGMVLDLGCGTGEHATPDRIGLDSSRGMILRARRRYALAMVGKGERLPFRSRAFSTVLCLYTVLNLSDSRKTIREISRVLEPNGVAIVSASSIYDRKGWEEKLRIEDRPRDVAIRIEKQRVRMHAFTKQELVGIFRRNGMRLEGLEGLFVRFKPRWGDYTPLSPEERRQLEQDRFLTGERAGMYLAAFRKSAAPRRPGPRAPSPGRSA